MIEIAIDKNSDNKFKNREYPVFEVNHFYDNKFYSYLTMADDIISRFIQNPILIIKILTNNCSLNFLALALFIKSCQINNSMECVVFKVSNYEQSLQSYKPFVALSTGIRLALRLYKLSSKEIYHELENMGYLGIQSHTNYLEHKMLLTLGNSKPPIITFKGDNISEAISIAATLKTFSLLNQGISSFAEVKMIQQNQPCNIEQIITDVLKNTLPLITDEHIIL